MLLWAGALVVDATEMHGPGVAIHVCIRRRNQMSELLGNSETGEIDSLDSTLVGPSVIDCPDPDHCTVPKELVGGAAETADCPDPDHCTVPK